MSYVSLKREDANNPVLFSLHCPQKARVLPACWHDLFLIYFCSKSLCPSLSPVHFLLPRFVTNSDSAAAFLHLCALSSQSAFGQGNSSRHPPTHPHDDSLSRLILSRISICWAKTADQVIIAHACASQKLCRHLGEKRERTSLLSASLSSRPSLPPVKILSLFVRLLFYYFPTTIQ